MLQSSNLASIVSRRFYHLRSNCNIDNWEQNADNHLFKIFWSPLNKLPEIVSPQNEWLRYISTYLRY